MLRANGTHKGRPGLPKAALPGRVLQQKQSSLPLQEHMRSADNCAAGELETPLGQEPSDWNISARSQTPRGPRPARHLPPQLQVALPEG